MNKKNNSVIGGLIGGVILVVVGFCIVIFFGKPMLDDGKESKTWPTAPGVITRSNVDRETRDGKRMYSVDVAYSFNVNGQGHVGQNVIFGGDYSSSRPGHARKVTGRYPVGKKVDVHYDAEDPGRNVLETGASWWSYGLYGLGCLFVVFGVLAFGSSVFRILVGMLAIGGAAAGVIGSARRRQAPHAPGSQPPLDSAGPQPGGGNDQTGGDGFDIQ